MRLDPARLRSALEAVAQGSLRPDEAARQLGAADGPNPATLDHDRPARCGVPEVIFCAGKAPDDVGRIAAELVAGGSDLLATRASPACFAAVRARVPDAVYDERAGVIVRRRDDAPRPVGLVTVVTAGTSDIPVAEEARATLETLGSRIECRYDVGVAGVHRVLRVRDAIAASHAVIVVAGMEGALASVVAGLVPCPVLAVPTSVGYGASFGGLAALLGMLNSCVPTVSVVNIDNGFGAAVIAHRINVQSAQATTLASGTEAASGDGDDEPAET